MRVLAASIALLAATGCAQDSTPVFRVTSDLVLLDVQVIHNKTNAAFGDLQAKDFVVSEDGATQKISFFGRDQLPLSVVLLFDLTQSVHGVLHRLADGAKAALDHLKPEDEVAVMVYAASARVVDGFTHDHSRTAAAVARAAQMSSDDYAYFNEAVYQAAAHLESSTNPSGRRVILWLTDNYPNAPRDLSGDAKPHTEQEAIRELNKSGTVVMPMLLKDPFAFWAEMVEISEASAAKRNPPGDARKYAELTGGFAAPMRGKGIDVRLAELIDSLRGRYTIGYRPSEDKPAGTFCRVKVELAPDAPLRPKEWRVLSQAGYYRK